MPAPRHWGPPQPWAPPNPAPGGPGYGANPQFMPPRPQDNYYPAPDGPPMEKQPHYGISAYGREASPSGVSAARNQPPPHLGSQVSSVTLDHKMMGAFIWQC
jgi:poly(rC)-binding protein 3/4